MGHGEHEWWMGGHCLLFHWVCIHFPSSGAQALTVRELTREISDAVATQDVAALAGYAKLPSVSLCAERSAIQIRGCDGETIAGHVPVNRELLAAIEIAAAQLDSGG